MAIPSRTFDSIEGNDREREKERGIRAAIWWSRRVIRAYSRRGWQGFIHIYRGRGSLSGQSKRRGCEVLSEAAHSIARHKWQPKVELTENESRRGPERGRIILPFAPTIFEFPGKKFSIRDGTCSLRARGFRAFAIFRWIGARIWLHERGKVVSGIIYKLIIKNSPIESFV